MDNIGKMTEIEVKGNTIIQILSEVIQSHLLKDLNKIIVINSRTFKNNVLLTKINRVEIEYYQYKEVKIHVFTLNLR